MSGVSQELDDTKKLLTRVNKEVSPAIGRSVSCLYTEQVCIFQTEPVPTSEEPSVGCTYMAACSSDPITSGAFCEKCLCPEAKSMLQRMRVPAGC